MCRTSTAARRRSGTPSSPLETADPWGAYAADQLAVMDHLGIDLFLVFGCCIGGPFILKLCELAPERIVAAVLEQPVEITASNRELFDNAWRQWGEQLMRTRDDLGSDEIEAFATTMWSSDFAVSVTRDQLRSFRTPMPRLAGSRCTPPDRDRPRDRRTRAGRRAARALEGPRASSRRHRSGRRFLRDHTPRDRKGSRELKSTYSSIMMAFWWILNSGITKPENAPWRILA